MSLYYKTCDEYDGESPYGWCPHFAHDHRGLVPVAEGAIEPLCGECGRIEKALVHHGYVERIVNEKAGDSGTLGSFIPPHLFNPGEWVKLRMEET